MVDPVEFVLSTMRPMAEYTFPYITSIVGVTDAEQGDHIGSGFRCMWRGRPCLVTVKHVVDEASQYALGPGFVAERGAAPRLLRDVRCDTQGSTDLAVYFLPDTLRGGDLLFWPEARIEESAEQRSKDYLFLHGFPGNRSRFLFEGLHNKSLPYGVMQREDDLPSNTQPHEFAMDYDPGNMLLDLGGSADFVEPPGLSGCPVFRIGASGIAPEQWSPERSMIVGVVTRWNHEKRVLLATGAGSLLELLRACGEP